MRQRMRDPLLFGLLFVVSCGAVAGWFVGAVVPSPIAAGQIELRQQPYNGHWEGDPFAIDDQRRLPIPFAYADFDLQMEIELGEGAIVDLLVRQVEPRLIGNRFEPFHGRFAVLRLSADRSGPAWLSRDQALLGDRDAGGVDLAPGHTASVWLGGRGRSLEANVAGRRLPPFAAADCFGSFLLVARGGTAVVKTLTITPLGQVNAALWSRWFWVVMGMLVGALVVAIAFALGASPWAVGALLVVTAWVVARDRGPPLWHPPPATLLAMLAASGCVALCLSPRRLWLALVAIGLLLAAPSLRHDEAEIDALFGPDAGSQLSEAAAQLVRGPHMIHDAGPEEHRVFLLGGQLLYGPGDPLLHLEGLLAGDLAAALNIVKPRRVDVPCLPTVDGHTAQQWRMFTQFYSRYRPDVIVFGVPTDEGAVDPATGKPRSFPSVVERVLGEAVTWCREHDTGLVIFAGPGLPESFAAVLKSVADRGVPLVRAAVGEDPAAVSKRLAAAIAPLLR